MKYIYFIAFLSFIQFSADAQSHTSRMHQNHKRHYIKHNGYHHGNAYHSENYWGVDAVKNDKDNMKDGWQEKNVHVYTGNMNTMRTKRAPESPNDNNYHGSAPETPNNIFSNR